MAILKAVNYKRSDWTAMCEAINYCRNPVKARAGPSVMGISQDTVKAFTVNKFLNNQENRKRLFKAFIVSMAAEWPEQPQDRAHYEALMQQLQDEAMAFWGRQGYQTQGTVHCNTAHPHFHLILDTCNVRTGKQFSQSPQMLRSFKDHMTDVMMELGLGEGILQDKLVINISEKEMRDEDDQDAPVKANYFEGSTAEAEVWFEDEDDSESGFNSEPISDPLCLNVLPSRWGRFSPPPLRKMVRIVSNSQGREMCRIVDNTQGREMCNIVDNNNH